MNPKQARKAVRIQVSQFKNKVFKKLNSVPCEICSFAVNRNECHIDHVIPFKNLYENFCEQQGNENFETFHHRTAKLRVTHSQCNLKRKK